MIRMRNTQKPRAGNFIGAAKHVRLIKHFPITRCSMAQPAAAGQSQASLEPAH